MFLPVDVDDGIFYPRTFQRDQKPIWFHAWEVYHGSNLLGTTADGEIHGAKEGPSYGVH
jgi:hypothetical protein